MAENYRVADAFLAQLHSEPRWLDAASEEARRPADEGLCGVRPTVRLAEEMGT